jgi:ribosomal protein S18 acetylase RimI-like enzyme
MFVREFYEESDSEDYARTLLLTLPCDDMNEARKNVQLIMERISKDLRELWVAEVNDRPAGFMLLEFEPLDKNVEIDWFDIHPDNQRHGVGTLLVQKAEERAREAHYQTITLHTASSNEKMRNFAKKTGFEEIKQLPQFWGEGTEDAYLFSKSVFSTY